MELVERLGSCIPRILQAYGRECFHFSDNYIRMSFPAAEKVKNKTTVGKTPQKILELIEYNRANFSHRNNLHLINRIEQEKSLSPPYIIVNDVKHDPSLHTYGGYYRYGYGYEYGHKKKMAEGKRLSGIEGVKKRLMDVGRN